MLSWLLSIDHLKGKPFQHVDTVYDVRVLCILYLRDKPLLKFCHSAEDFHCVSVTKLQVLFSSGIILCTQICIQHISTAESCQASAKAFIWGKHMGLKHLLPCFKTVLHSVHISNTIFSIVLVGK